jgi:thymidylate synthase (FAD)
MFNPAADELLDKEIPVLDKGFIRLVDYMGSDKRIVDAARVSYQSGTTQVSTDEQLIRYLLRHKHTTPFEKVRFEFHVKLPIFVARQWIRHRTGSFNEMSARYSVLENEFHLPDTIRKQSTTNKQGSEGGFAKDRNDMFCAQVEGFSEDSYALYEELVSQDIAREQSRMVLPVNIYTQWYWTVDLWNLMHFMRLRSDSHAQKEIRDYSVEIEKIVQTVCPAAYSAWCSYYRDAVTLSSYEMASVRDMLSFVADDLATVFEAKATEHGMTTRTPSGKLTREFKEFLGKFDVESPTE